MMKNQVRSCAWVLVLMVSAAFLGCGSERPALPETTPATTRAAAEPPPRAVLPKDVTVFPDGSSKIGPRITDVAMLKLLPNGTYARTCGPPDPETRTMMEGTMRARRGSRR